MNARTALIAVVSLLLSMHALGGTLERARYLMGTTCEIAIEANDAEQIERAFAETARIEQMLSTWRESSELSQLNANGGGRVSPELASLLAIALAWEQRTSGSFSPLIDPLVQAWKTRETGAVPSAAAITAARRRMDVDNVTLDGRDLTLRNGARFEEGGFGKGYAIDRMLQALSSPRAIVNFGGQIAAKGPLQVTVADPRERSRPVIAMTINDASISTSSGSEQTFTIGGRAFSHILDPRSGEALPPRGSVSVIATRALDADILSTALYVMGEADGLRWADANGVAALFITDSSIRRSAAFRERVRDLSVLDKKFELKD